MAANGMNLECRMYDAKNPEVDHAVKKQGKSTADSGPLLNYNDIGGMILYTELSRHRIRGISKDGRIEPMMVLRADKEKSYIDLSKRRVSEEDIQGCEVDHAVKKQGKSTADSGPLLNYNDIEGMILYSELSRHRIRGISSLIKYGRIEPCL